MTDTSTDPKNFYTGTSWQQTCVGRVPVGYSSEEEFNSVNKTGGHKELQNHTHYLSLGTSANGNHAHDIRYKNRVAAGSNAWTIHNSPSDQSGITTNTMLGAGNHSHTISGNTNSAGSGNAKNLQPYQVKYFWKRLS